MTRSGGKYVDWNDGMDSSRCFVRHLSAKLDVSRISPPESEMQSTTIAVDLAKNVIEVAVANADHRIICRERLGRLAFAERLASWPVATVVMEACGLSLIHISEPTRPY